MYVVCVLKFTFYQSVCVLLLSVYYYCVYITVCIPLKFSIVKLTIVSRGDCITISS